MLWLVILYFKSVTFYHAILSGIILKKNGTSIVPLLWNRDWYIGNYLFNCYFFEMILADNIWCPLDIILHIFRIFAITSYLTSITIHWILFKLSNVSLWSLDNQKSTVCLVLISCFCQLLCFVSLYRNYKCNNLVSPSLAFILHNMSSLVPLCFHKILIFLLL